MSDSSVPHLVTEVPGPRAQALVARSDRAVSPSLPRAYPLAVKQAQGVVVEDLDGNRFLDCAAGIAVCSTGHCHPRVSAAIQEQAARLLHICGTDYYDPLYITLAERLGALAPGRSPKRVFLGNSGAEAVEAALKLVRHHTGRSRVIAFFGAFHGRTMGAVSLTASKPVYHGRFGPLVPGIVHVPYAYCYRCTYNLTYPDCGLACVEYIEDVLFARTIPPEEVAAVFVEPVQGEGGYIVPPPGWLPRLRALCDRYGILLVADEVQSGMGRTGKMLAIEHWGGRARCRVPGQGAGLGDAALGHDRSRGDHELAAGCPRQHLWRQSRLLCGGPRHAGRLGGGGAAGERGSRRPAAAGQPTRPGPRKPPPRRRAGAGVDDRRGAGARQRNTRDGQG